ncbi:MAG: SpoIVB peptidase S55 domain-containing protein [Bacilli bacterium]
MIFKNFKNKLLLILSLATIIIPISANAYSEEVILGGENVGIEVSSNGVLIVGFYDVKGTSPGREAGLKIGDTILKVDDTVIQGITDLSKHFNDSKTLKITYKHGNVTKNTTLNLVKENETYKTGLYVKDSIVGIGTLTFIDPSTKRFGALGHEILEQTTGTKFEIKDGTIFESNVTGIEKADRGSVGEKNAIYNEDEVYGNIDKNDITGIYGNYSKSYDKNDLIKISSDIKPGKAIIKTVILGQKKQEFEITILNVDKNHKTKNILFEVTDETLLSKGNGIVQGMSGSPIIQDNKLVGAVTHVVVDNPHKGYGIMITNMLKESEK